MNKNANDIFVGEFNVSNDKCDGDERSESSSDSSSSEKRYKKTSKRVEKVRTTPGSKITLQSDAFRGAMNPEEGISSSTGLLRNPRGENIQEESGEIFKAIFSYFTIWGKSRKVLRIFQFRSKHWI